MTFKEFVYQRYEIKKINLLRIHRLESRKTEEIKLVHEINALAEVLKEKKINIDNISETLRVYPALIKE